MSVPGVSGTRSTRKRHMSMQDRVDMYNTVMALEDEDSNDVSVMEDKMVAAGPRVRKTSKVMFEPPEIEVAHADDGKESVTAEVHQVE